MTHPSLRTKHEESTLMPLHGPHWLLLALAIGCQQPPLVGRGAKALGEQALEADCASKQNSDHLHSLQPKTSQDDLFEQADTGCSLGAHQGTR